ncbi:VWA domain-containing protein [Ruegeria hyattellae]|uniref:VWA domain-containing protein n=1 Tax=Ruegeria hyattellae TaxID=3233337 RepID=UPI00355BC442
MMEVFEAFHLIRPFWLLAILPVVTLWYAIRPKDTRASETQNGVAPHLAAALEVGGGALRRIYPIDGVALLGILLASAAAGPTWSKLPNPLVAETAPLVVALKVTSSMETPDLAPSRLERAKYKILDLIEARAGARTALVAYAGTAHRVSPLTEDPKILRPLLQGLTPAVMPVDGDNAGNALQIALDILATAETPGAVLFALDDLNPADVDAMNARDEESPTPLVFLVAAPSGTNLPQLDKVQGATVVQITTDDSDLGAIERRVRSAHAAALAADDRLRWDDRGWWLAWPAALLCALWFRRGWTMRWVLALLTLSFIHTPTSARAGGWIDWFLTPDQQGRLAFEDKEFAEAGELFEDPLWKGYAKYKSGQYEEAIAIFARLDTAEAAFAQGMAEIKSRQYRPAVRSFETAQVRRPDFPEAARNREVAMAIVEYVETTREQSDTGEESGIGADDVVFDNEAARGAETQIEAPNEDAAPLTADQWIQSIDTDMGDFLRSRFLLDNAGDG